MLKLAENLTHTGSAIVATVPIYTNPLGGRYRAGAPIGIDVDRAAAPAASSLAEIFGADMPHWWADDSKAVVRRGDGSTVNFDTNIPYAAWSNYNFAALAGPDQNLSPRVGVAAGPSGLQFTIANNAGFARFTFATAPSAGNMLVLGALSPVTIYSGNDRTKRMGGAGDTPVRSYDLLWVRNNNTGQASPTANDGTTVTVRPLSQ